MTLSMSTEDLEKVSCFLLVPVVCRNVMPAAEQCQQRRNQQSDPEGGAQGIVVTLVRPVPLRQGLACSSLATVAEDVVDATH